MGQDTLNLMTEIIEKEGVDCDFWRGLSFDVAMDEDAVEFFRSNYEAFKADGGTTDGIVEWIGDAAEARKVNPFKNVSYIRAHQSRSSSAHELLAHSRQLNSPHPLFGHTSSLLISSNSASTSMD